MRGEAAVVVLVLMPVVLLVMAAAVRMGALVAVLQPFVAAARGHV